ncbi:HAMP linker domain protein, partial [mine drainage metagenome]
ERDVLGRPLPPVMRDFLVPGPTGPSHRQPPPFGGALVLTTPQGQMYQVIVTNLRHHPLLFFGALGLPGVPGTTIALALVVSTLTCFLLARYLVGPIERLRQAARAAAAGNLDVRVAPSMRGRHDDLARLAADFDAMAERVQGLLESRQRLLRDVSHELRSAPDAAAVGALARGAPRGAAAPVGADRARG